MRSKHLNYNRVELAEPWPVAYTAQYDELLVALFRESTAGYGHNSEVNVTGLSCILSQPPHPSTVTVPWRRLLSLIVKEIAVRHKY